MISTTRGNDYYVETYTCPVLVICCRGTHYQVCPSHIIKCVPPKTWNIAREPLPVAIYFIKRNPYSKEASRPQRKQLLPLVPTEAISKEAISKEAISKEAIPKEAILNAPTLSAPTMAKPRPIYMLVHSLRVD